MKWRVRSGEDLENVVTRVLRPAQHLIGKVAPAGWLTLPSLLARGWSRWKGERRGRDLGVVAGVGLINAGLVVRIERILRERKLTQAAAAKLMGMKAMD